MEKNINNYDSCCGQKSGQLPSHHHTSAHTICYIAGHSGGHIIPCLTLARDEKEHCDATIMFITSTKALDTHIVQESVLVDHHYTLPIMQKRRWYFMPVLAAALVWSFIKALFIFIRHRPACVISTGSIIAIPGCIAAWILRIPIELFEVNAKPGKTIIFLARFATKIYVCFSQPKHFFTNVPCEIQPYPIRFTGESRSLPAHLAHFTPDRFTIFIQGGSQGSFGINTLLEQVITANPALAKQVQVIHQTGSSAELWHKLYAQHHIPAHVFAYEHDVAAYYHYADLIICRSGAGSLFEVLHFQKPCITVPLATATTHHQLDNAHAMATAYPELFCVIEPGSDTMQHFEKAFISAIKPIKDLKISHNNL